MKATLLLMTSLLVAACSAGYSPRYYYESVEVSNLSGEAISDLQVQIGERDYGCDAVAKNAMCHQRFGKLPYPQQPLRVSWQVGDGGEQTQQVDPMVPATLSPALPLRVMLDIGEDGSVKAYFKQNGFKN
jgi:hypothetical protein